MRVGGVVAVAPVDGRWSVIDKYGQVQIADPADGSLEMTFAYVPFHLGHDCAVWLADRWWGLDPLTGRIAATSKPPWEPPPGRWIGIGRRDDDTLVLASADQFVLLLDPMTGEERGRFAAAVPPAQRFDFGECTPVAGTREWIATLDHLTSRLHVYDGRGAALGTVRLDRALPLEGHVTVTVAAGGEHAGVVTGPDRRVFTFRLRVVPDCSPPSLTARRP